MLMKLLTCKEIITIQKRTIWPHTHTRRINTNNGNLLSLQLEGFKYKFTETPLAVLNLNFIIFWSNRQLKNKICQKCIGWPRIENRKIMMNWFLCTDRVWVPTNIFIYFNTPGQHHSNIIPIVQDKWQLQWISMWQQVNMCNTRKTNYVYLCHSLVGISMRLSFHLT